MKKLLFLLVMVAITKIGYGQQATATTKPAVDLAVFEWDAQSFDFGKIKQGVPVTHEFKFTNKGKVPLLIANAQPSCGCTTPDWSRQPVPPGEKGFIKATFNASAVGVFNKSVTVTANVETGAVVLMIKGEVTPPVQ